MIEQHFCVCGCGNLVTAHEGKGRPGRYFSAACRKRAQRMREAGSAVTKIANDVTKLWDTILQGDALMVLSQLPDAFVQCCITSPPYYALRDYGVDGQIGLEATPQEYIKKLVAVFREVRRVLRDDGTLWVNIGDTYANDRKWGGHPSGKHRKALHSMQRPRRFTGLPDKSLLGIPWRLAFALQEDGWILRSDIIWHKPTAMPESVTTRPTKAHEYLFLLAKSERYYYNAQAIVEPAVSTHPSGNGFKRSARLSYRNADGTARGNDEQWQVTPFRNRRSVWSIPTQPFPEAHFAVMPEKLVEPAVLAGSRPGDLILDPFCGAGTVPLVARFLSRHYLGVELSADYIRLACSRLERSSLSLWHSEQASGSGRAMTLPAGSPGSEVVSA